MTYYFKFTHLPHSTGYGMYGIWEITEDKAACITIYDELDKNRTYQDLEETVHSWRHKSTSDNVPWFENVKIDIMLPEEAEKELFLAGL